MLHMPVVPYICEAWHCRSWLSHDLVLNYNMYVIICLLIKKFVLGVSFAAALNRNLPLAQTSTVEYNHLTYNTQHATHDEIGRT